MLTTERRDRIIDILKAKKHVSPKNLAEELYCSPATIRRDLVHLEKEGLIIRARGSVSISPNSNHEHSHFIRETINRDGKKYISEIATNFISTGHSLFLDSSSTVYTICPYLKDYQELTIVTNGIKTALELSTFDHVHAFFVGGKIKESTSTVGEFAGDFINNFKANLSILSCRGVNENGIFEADHDQIFVKRRMLANSDMTILLCDHMKIGQKFTYKVADFDEVDCIITDKKPPEEIIRLVNNSGSEILW